MPRGLRVPVGADPTGGAALVESDENDQKIIGLALGSCDNENAFQQDVGLGNDMVFDINDPTLRARIYRRLISIFQDFETQKRYRLLRDTVRWETGEEGELVLAFKYMNLESDEPRDFTQKFTANN
jgi:hypothetical protein